MNAPLIGVTCGLREEGKTLFLFRNYMQAILDAGGVPVILSLDTPVDRLESALSRLDGLLVTGGLDLCPESYGHARHPLLGETSQERDDFEIAAIRLSRGMGKPVLGICRGMQAMGAALGGALWQDLPTQRPSEINHFPCRTDWHIRHAHEVAVTPGSLLEKVAGSGSYAVNSYHHQAIQAAPEGLRVSAVAPDGVVEAIEGDGAFFLGVQWHPERLYTQDDHARALFAALVGAANRNSSFLMRNSSLSAATSPRRPNP